MNETNRKFVIGNLEIRKFIASDYLYIIAFLISVLYYFYVLEYKPENKLATSLFISWLFGFQTISGPFGLRFRNIYFSVFWLLLSSIYLIGNNYFGFVPILTFVLYHILRMIFWNKHSREFIPYQTGKGAMFRHRSFFEGRTGNNKDKLYTKILLLIGISIILFPLVEMIGVKK